MDKKTNNWQIKKLEDLLDYIQPTKYIVKSTDYSENYNIPVLTAGKSFILGKTNETEGIFENVPVIIFDDFTTANKLVNFKFKVKSSAMKILKPKNEDVNLLFVYYYMQTLRISFDTHKRYWISVFSKLPIPLPDSETQHAIVSKIEELFSELDKGIAELKTAQQQLKTYRQSVLKSAFEGKLTNDNVKEGELPEGWKLKNLGEIFKVSSGKGIKINQLKGGDYCVYGGNGLNGYHSEYFIEESVLIIGRVGVKCGVTHITKPKGWVSDNALIVKPIIEDFDIKFFKLRLEFENLNKLSVSTAQPVISGNSIYSVQVFLPKLEEQYRIVQEIESRLSVADKMEQSIQESLQKAEALRQSILKKAFCGELV